MIDRIGIILIIRAVVTFKFENFSNLNNWRRKRSFLGAFWAFLQTLPLLPLRLSKLRATVAYDERDLGTDVRVDARNGELVPVLELHLMSHLVSINHRSIIAFIKESFCFNVLRASLIATFNAWALLTHLYNVSLIIKGTWKYKASTFNYPKHLFFKIDRIIKHWINY